MAKSCKRKNTLHVLQTWKTKTHPTATYFMWKGKCSCGWYALGFFGKHEYILTQWDWHVANVQA